MDSYPCAYSPRDVAVTCTIHRDWITRYVRVQGVWYNREEYSRYKREKRRWARDDKTVSVPLPWSFKERA